MDIRIIGGGITGLTTALALQKLGINCKVYERAPELNEVGAGIWMQPNAMKVLDWIGIGDKVREAGMQMRHVEITDHKLQPIRRSHKEFITDGSDELTTSIHRARLQQTLFDALPPGMVELGCTYKGHQVVGKKVFIQFQDSTVEADLLLGADGIHSGVRNQLFPSSPTRYSGQSCWRGIARMTFPDAYQASGIEAWGDRIRFGFAGISAQEVYWFAVVKTEQGGVDERDSLKKELLHTFSDFAPLVKEIISNTPLEKIIRSDISDLKRLKKWHLGPVCLIGDAAHATTPNMGQGGGQGVEDAYYLSQILAKSSAPEQAFERFEKMRRKKVDYVVNTSWRMGQMAHSPIGQSFLKMALRFTPEKIMLGQMKQLYAVKTDF